MENMKIAHIGGEPDASENPGRFSAHLIGQFERGSIPAACSRGLREIDAKAAALRKKQKERAL